MQDSSFRKRKETIPRQEPGTDDERVLAPTPSITPANGVGVQLAAAIHADHIGGPSHLHDISSACQGPGQLLITLRPGSTKSRLFPRKSTAWGTVGQQQYTANKAGFIIHSAIHMARPDAQCVWHMHTLAGMAISAQDEGLLPAHMYSHNFWNRVSYHDFEGPSMRLEERARIVRSLGIHDALNFVTRNTNGGRTSPCFHPLRRRTARRSARAQSASAAAAPSLRGYTHGQESHRPGAAPAAECETS